MPYGNINVDTVTTSTTGGVLGAGNASIMKNRIINGAMVIDQRNAGASVTNNGTNAQYAVDRFVLLGSVTTKYTAQQNAGSITSAVGFQNYLGITSSSAYSVGAGDYFCTQQSIEGLNVADLGWGTANAKTVTLSFQVYSSLTGTFGGSLTNSDSNRSYPFTYSIPVANTWTSISVTIAGDTSGTWLTTNGIGIKITFSFGMGSTYSGTAGAWAAAQYLSATGATSVVGTNGATWYITGCQLEVGSSATGYEYENYTSLLQKCQRYYEIGTNYVDAGYVPANTPVSFAGSTFAVTKRIAPNMTFTTVSFSNGYGATSRTIYVSGFWRYILATATGALAGSETYTASAEL
jgi:hypothetical protein